ncbi:MAG TPA: alpha-1,4-glucan--maltose-1-phosphate maltosyltransferase, partial [Gemmatimonadaceae bacterium]|nr:alpha-1,4-glucan--maltose-1-phosphate maltosyltransferase [Gemmatimonadaceae bacterium]
MSSRTSDRRSHSRRVEYLVIECTSPELDGGRYPVKRIVGDRVWVGADIVNNSHDQLAARVMYRLPATDEWLSSPMTFDNDSDRWYGSFIVDRIGRWSFAVEAWTDRFATWRTDLQKKVAAGDDVSLEILEGAQLARAASRGARSAAARASLLMTAKALEDRRDALPGKRLQRALDEDFLMLMRAHHRPADLTRAHRELEIVVDRPRARFASWYEFFPRSHGGFIGAASHLPRLAELGFDVAYLPPIHPIGRRFRKGKNSSLTCEPDDVGSPWAIGSEDGGHTAIEPSLGDFSDFDQFVETARGLGMEIALDYALQCSPDHPWVTEHPGWFFVRPDQSIKYAENPPKKYQDIYPLNFWCDDRVGLWTACRDVLLFWIGHGVTTFRVDNPHTKPSAFWEWVIREVQREHPDVIFFAEAFTRPKRMKSLAKLGFTMSYTYFTWRNTPVQLREYLTELTATPVAEYFRGNVFTNTPDILNEYLVNGGRPAFRVRLLLAGTLSPLYGMYSGFELCENTPAQPGSEEYLNSEKYQLRPRDFDAEGNINAEIRHLNRMRREHPALQGRTNLSFHTSENPQILFYRRAAHEAAVQWSSGRAAPIPAPILATLTGDTGTANGHRRGDIL